MAYCKLTKRQRKNRDRILAWLRSEPFQENSRSKPGVPELALENVLAQYVPPDITGAGQFFTPLEMSRLLFDNWGLYLEPGDKVLDPCAGIGHLLYYFRRWASADVAFDAVELEEECCKIGARLFPWAVWFNAVPFDLMALLEERYDYVIMNPPLGTTRGIGTGQEMCEGRCNRSEHVFLELAIRCLKPGGQALVFAPYNYLDRLPKQADEWFHEHASVEMCLGPLPGQFDFTKIELFGYVLQRRESGWKSPEAAIPPPVSATGEGQQLRLW